MTLPDEELYSLLETRKFLFALLNPKVTPKIPKYARERAAWLLHHYPYPIRIEDMYKDAVNKKEIQ